MFRPIAPLLCILCLIPAFSCGRDEAWDVFAGRSMAELVVRSAAGMEKFDVMAFDSSSGKLVCRGRADDGKASLTLPLWTACDICLLANIPPEDVSRIRCIGDYVSSRVCLEDGSPFSLPSSGRACNVEVPSAEVVVEASRLFSKVSVLRISPLFMTDNPPGRKVTLNRIYLVNVNGSVPFEGTAEVGEVWHNALFPEKDLPPQLQRLLVRDMDYEVSDTTAIPLSVELFCCPNPVSNDVTFLENPEWSPRNTRVVVEFTVGSRKTYYPVSLPSMRSGTEYRINGMILSGDGSPHPDIPVDGRDFLDSDIVVVPWRDSDVVCPLY